MLSCRMNMKRFVHQSGHCFNLWRVFATAVSRKESGGLAGCLLMLLVAGSAAAAEPATSAGSANAQGQATPASEIHVPPGFQVELIYSVPRQQGSWIAMCFDDRGRIYVCEQGKRLFRVTPPPFGQNVSAEVELVSAQWAGDAQGMAFIKGHLYLVRNGNHRREGYTPDSIVRISDSDGDDRLDRVEHLFDFPSVPGEQAPWTEHGVHGIVLGPDERSIWVISGDRNPLPTERSRVPSHWNHDAWGMRYNPRAYAGGWVMRADLDGKNPEVFCTGLRNSYDLAFNRHGDLFTFDSDLEFDIGLPNYRPTAIRQLVSGTDGGWGGRGGHMIKNLAARYEEIQPPVKNIGPGSPTGVCFGYGSEFPARYQEALFACDWSYGRIFAAHLRPAGASYDAEAETFLSAQGLPVADLAVSPADGALYFVVGGRGTQSGLYRVSYVGSNESTESAPPALLSAASRTLRESRQALEQFHGIIDPQAVAVARAQLSHTDRAIRSAARTALEWQPAETWRARAVAEENPRVQLQALLALVRSTDGDTAVQAEVLRALEGLSFQELGPEEKTWLLRVLEVSAIRHGSFPEETAQQWAQRLAPALPDGDPAVDLALATALSHLGSTACLDPTLRLLEACRSQEEQVSYLGLVMRINPNHAAWTPERRARLFEIAADRVPHWKGGSRVKPRREQALQWIVKLLSDEQQAEFADRIADLQKAPPLPAVAAHRKFVKAWTMEDLAPGLEEGLKQERNLENGRALYAATACLACHNFRGEGGLAGPDLNGAGGRFSAYDLLDNILNPSKVINEQYGLLLYTMVEGNTLLGRTVNMVGDRLMIATNPLDPGASVSRVKRSAIESIAPAPTSFMPPGLLNTLTREDILDLLAYLRQKPGSPATP